MQAERVPAQRRWFTWSAIALGVGFVLSPVVYLALVVFTFAAVDGSPKRAGCSEVMEFAGASMPAQATGASCTDTNSLMDRGYTAEFRMPRADLAASLTAAFPRVRQVETYGPGLRFANSQETDGTRPQGQAMFLELDVTYEDDATALVRVKAFDV
ncbi:hypothetical protein ACFWA9_38410 [Kitasatospora sp. NPDC059973]|uniref:hypothetical protein n=1 Tax=Kitasatospora sp. NPDC059973 TaxID=3347020 RepID=UPI0036AB34B3